MIHALGAVALYALMMVGAARFLLLIEYGPHDPGLWVRLRVMLASDDRLRAQAEQMQEMLGAADSQPEERRAAERYVAIISGSQRRRKARQAARRARQTFFDRKK